MPVGPRAAPGPFRSPTGSRRRSVDRGHLPTGRPALPTPRRHGGGSSRRRCPPACPRSPYPSGPLTDCARHVTGNRRPPLTRRTTMTADLNRTPRRHTGRPPHALNRILMELLRSPLHGLLDPGLCELTFDGRRTGRLVTLPVIHADDGDQVIVLIGDADAK